LEKRGRERKRIVESNEWYHLLNRQQRRKKAFAKLYRQAQRQRKQGSNIFSSYKENELIGTTREQEVRRTDDTRRTVMVCDDERDLLLMFTIGLQASYDVLTTKSGEECIRKYLDAKHSGRKIDLILLDYKLGDTTGDYVAHKIKELNDVKIIMITAYEVNYDIARELEDNELVVDIVQKPVDIDSLTAKITQCIGN
jgi:CheY-like chemotaxis protein